jgi:hypothetical protein
MEIDEARREPPPTGVDAERIRRHGSVGWIDGGDDAAGEQQAAGGGALAREYKRGVGQQGSGHGWRSVVGA